MAGRAVDAEPADRFDAVPERASIRHIVCPPTGADVLPGKIAFIGWSEAPPWAPSGPSAPDRPYAILLTLGRISTLIKACSVMRVAGGGGRTGQPSDQPGFSAASTRRTLDAVGTRMGINTARAELVTQGEIAVYDLQGSGSSPG